MRYYISLVEGDVVNFKDHLRKIADNPIGSAKQQKAHRKSTELAVQRFKDLSETDTDVKIIKQAILNGTVSFYHYGKTKKGPVAPSDQFPPNWKEIVNNIFVKKVAKFTGIEGSILQQLDDMSNEEIDILATQTAKIIAATYL